MFLAKKKENKPADIQLRGDSWRAGLLVHPYHRKDITVEITAQGNLMISAKFDSPKWYKPPASWFVNLNLNKQYELSGLSMQLWEWCDGVKTMEEIIDLFALKYQYTFHEARVSVISYLKKLTEKGILLISE
jgi:hypothetical protein